MPRTRYLKMSLLLPKRAIERKREKKKKSKTIEANDILKQQKEKKKIQQRGSKHS
jgi:hypothetical protein